MHSKLIQKLKLPIFLVIFFLILILIWKLLNLPSDEQLISIAKVYFNKYGLITVFLASIVEGALLAGWYVPGGLVIFLGVILSDSLAGAMYSVFMTFLGFSIAHVLNFLVGWYGWYKLLIKFGLRNSLEKAHKDFEKYGWKTIYIAYWEPNLASLVSTAAGISKAPFNKFIFHSTIAIIIWAIFWGVVAYVFGQQILSYLGIVFFSVMTIWIVYIVIKHKTKDNKNNAIINK